MPATREGIIETQKTSHGFARDLVTWQRLFVHPSSCAGGVVPPPGTLIAFMVDPTDPRGPSALRVVAQGPPAPPIVWRCLDCDQVFAIDAGAQAWLRSKGLRPSRRCRACRQAARECRS